MPDSGTDTALLEVARAFRPRIIVQRDRIEAARRLPEDVARELARAGFFRIFLPTAYGGPHLTPPAGIRLFEEVARAAASAAPGAWTGNPHWPTSHLPPPAADMCHPD